MKDKGLMAVFVVPVLLLAIPLLGNRFVEGWNWEWPSFVLAWGMMTAVGLAYRIVTQANGSVSFCIATGVALLAGFVIVWGNLAVGFIGSEDNPANLLYAIVVAVAIGGAALTRFEPARMSAAMFATAIVQLIVPAIALIFWPHDFSPGVLPVFALNGALAAIFAASALLYRRAARRRRRRDSEVHA